MNGKIIPFLLLGEAIKKQHNAVSQQDYSKSEEAFETLRMAKERAYALLDKEEFELFLKVETAAHFHIIEWLKGFWKERAPEPKIYFAESDDGLIKIGRTTVPAEDRIAQFKNISSGGARFLFDVPGTIKEETFLHQAFKEDNVRGEWFRPSERLMNTIQRIKEGVAIADAVENCERG